MKAVKAQEKAAKPAQLPAAKKAVAQKPVAKKAVPKPGKKAKPKKQAVARQKKLWHHLTARQPGSPLN